MSKWKEKKLFTADELSKLDSEKSATGKVKYLLNVLINQDDNTKEKIVEIFDTLSKIGVGFSNLPEVSVHFVMFNIIILMLITGA